MRNESFEKYFSNLKGKITQYANMQHLRDRGQKWKREMLKYFQNIFPKFSLHIIMIRARKWNKT